MAFEFHLPDIGEGVVEGEIVAWKVAEGDTVTLDQPIVEVMTDKATVEIPAPAAGTITALKAKAGEVVPIHDQDAFAIGAGLLREVERLQGLERLA